jgi:hypothetical protein
VRSFCGHADVFADHDMQVDLRAVGEAQQQGKHPALRQGLLEVEQLEGDVLRPQDVIGPDLQSRDRFTSDQDARAVGDRRLDRDQVAGLLAVVRQRDLYLDPAPVTGVGPGVDDLLPVAFRHMGARAERDRQ